MRACVIRSVTVMLRLLLLLSKCQQNAAANSNINRREFRAAHYSDSTASLSQHSVGQLFSNMFSGALMSVGCPPLLAGLWTCKSWGTHLLAWVLWASIDVRRCGSNWAGVFANCCCVQASFLDVCSFPFKKKKKKKMEKKQKTVKIKKSLKHRWRQICWHLFSRHTENLKMNSSVSAVTEFHLMLLNTFIKWVKSSCFLNNKSKGVK